MCFFGIDFLAFCFFGLFNFVSILESPGPPKIPKKSKKSRKKNRFFNVFSFEGEFWDGFGRIWKSFWMDLKDLRDLIVLKVLRVSRALKALRVLTRDPPVISQTRDRVDQGPHRAMGVPGPLCLGYRVPGPSGLVS